MNSLDKARGARIGLEGYCRMLAFLKAPRTTGEVQAHMALNETTARQMLRWMLRLKLIHRPSWFRPAPHSRMVPRWQLGADGDVPCPDRPDVSPPRRIHSGLMLIAATVEVLQEPTTLKELAAELQMHHESASRLVRHLRTHGLSHIRGYVRQRVGVTVALHVYGGGNDAARPRRESVQKMAARHRKTYEAKRRHLAIVRALAGQESPAQSVAVAA